MQMAQITFSWIILSEQGFGWISVCQSALYLGAVDSLKGAPSHSTQGPIPSQKEADTVYYDLESIAENRILWLKEIFRHYLS